MVDYVELRGRHGWNLAYEPSTGNFIHMKSHGRVKKGDVVTSLDSHGYIRVSKDGKRYLAHRVAFLFMTGEWPKDDIDHKDQDRTNNKWDNLRECSRSQNLGNQRKTRGSSIYKGVTKNRGRWVAQLGRQGGHYLGASTCEKEAALIYNHHAEIKFGTYASFNVVFEDVDEGSLSGEA